MIIKNYHELATSKLRKDVLDIAEAGIAAVEPRRMLSSLLSYNEDFNSVRVFNHSYDMMKGRIFVIGGGKATGAMAEALERIIGAENITDGLVAVKDKQYKTRKIKTMRAGHPYPDWRSVWASKRMLAFKEKHKIGAKDLVICLISGGASAMLAAPVAGITLRDKQNATKLLLGSGAAVSETNMVRKHLSRIKGGQLAAHFAPARVLTLIISDVIGSRIEAIGSGPTVADTSTFKDVLLILDQHGIRSRLPQRVACYIEDGASGRAPETPKEVLNADNYIIGSNQSSLESMAHKATSLGLRPVIVSDEVTGDPNVMAYKIVRRILQGDFEGYDVLLMAGETNPKLPEKHGKGGRNQQFAAASMLALKHLGHDWAMASLSTDGSDYDQKIAGAIVDRELLSAAEKRGINPEPYVRTYDTYSLFRRTKGAHIKTGYTGTNVADVMVYRLGA